MSYSTEQIRNVALAGHPGAGKTTLFEALLHAGGAIQAAGSIERGSTVSDFDPIEKDRGHSIDAAIASTDHGQASIHVNLIDTPGYPDFRGPTLSALAAVETVAIVVDADTRHRPRHPADDGARKARRLCRVHGGQQDRPCRCARLARCSTSCATHSATKCCRSTCRPRAASASSTVSPSPRR